MKPTKFIAQTCLAPGDALTVGAALILKFSGILISFFALFEFKHLRVLLIDIVHITSLSTP